MELRHPFESEHSTNQLRGYPISGRILTVDMERWQFDPASRIFEAFARWMTIRAYVDSELEQQITISIDALCALIVDGQERYEQVYPNETKDIWTRQQVSPALVRIAGGYGGGWLITTEDELRMITRKVINLPTGA
jgi:hypothetical protein